MTEKKQQPLLIDHVAAALPQFLGENVTHPLFSSLLWSGGNETHPLISSRSAGSAGKIQRCREPLQ